MRAASGGRVGLVLVSTRPRHSGSRSLDDLMPSVSCMMSSARNAPFTWFMRSVASGSVDALQRRFRNWLHSRANECPKAFPASFTTGPCAVTILWQQESGYDASTRYDIEPLAARIRCGPRTLDPRGIGGDPCRYEGPPRERKPSVPRTRAALHGAGCRPRRLRLGTRRRHHHDRSGTSSSTITTRAWGEGLSMWTASLPG